MRLSSLFTLESNGCLPSIRLKDSPLDLANTTSPTPIATEVRSRNKTQSSFSSRRRPRSTREIDQSHSSLIVMVQAGDRAVKNASSPGGAGGGRGRSSVLLNQAAPDGEGKGEERTRDKRPKEITSPLVSPGGSTGSTNTTSNPPRPSQHRRLPKLQQAQSHDPDPTRLPMIAPRINRATSSTSSSTTPVPAVPMEGVNSPSTSNSTTPVAAKPPGPLPRIPVFPLVDSYVPDPTSTDRRHPRQLVPKDLGFPTAEMNGRIRKEDLDDRLLMATCAVMHRHQNRALCPKEVAEVMLEQGWLKNAYVSDFSTSLCFP